MTLLHPVLLDRSDLASAWPLVRMAAPGVTLQAWLAEGRRQITGGGVPRRGLFALACERGYFYGLAAFSCAANPPAATALEVRVLSLAALASTEVQVADFCDGMLSMARTLRCELLRLQVPELLSFIPPEALERRGFTRRGDVLECGLRSPGRIAKDTLS